MISDFTGNRDVVRILDRMRRLCSRREYCAWDISRKVHTALAALQYDEADEKNAAAWIMDSLVRDRYVDDRRYAAAFARDKSALSGWGRLKIRNALAAKGIDRDIVSDALASIDREASDVRMRKVLETKYKSLKKSFPGSDMYSLKSRMLRFAVGRGYSYDEALSETERLVSGKG